MKDNEVDYRTILPRKTAVAACVIGMIELLVATFTIVCAFVIFGGFCNQLDCQDISNAIGLWLGFPLIIPSILGVVVLGTRHRQAVAAFGITNLLVLIISIVHVVLVKNDDSDVWSVHLDAYDKGACTVEFPSRCRCTIDGVSKTLPYGCDLIQFGSDLNWILFGLSIVSMVFCLASVILSVIGINQIPAKPRRS